MWQNKWDKGGIKKKKSFLTINKFFCDFNSSKKRKSNQETRKKGRATNQLGGYRRKNNNIHIMCVPLSSSSIQQLVSKYQFFLYLM